MGGTLSRDGFDHPGFLLCACLLAGHGLRGG